MVQELLADKRKLLVANERLRLELADERALSQGTDPRLQRLEDEVARLRLELARARMELELYEDGLNAILDLSFQAGLRLSLRQED